MKRLITAVGLLACCLTSPSRAEFRAGAVVVDVTPTLFPVLVNGGMLSRTADSVHTPISARAIVLADDDTEIAIVVVDSCMMPRPFLDEVKKLTADQTGIPALRILISATHAHSVPSTLACLGTDADPNYVPFLRGKLIEAVTLAKARLEPAVAGFAVANAADFTALRRWIRRPDRIEMDPFGNPTVRANMHAGRVWDDVVGESGPEDPDFSMISFRSVDGRPIALLANFSMHYFGDKAIGADYFGLFCNGFQQAVAPETENGKPSFVAALSHGCSGDIWRRDYTKPESEWGNPTIEEYTDKLLKLALEAYQGISYESDLELGMAETRLPMKYRVPDKQRLEWAQRIVAAMGDRIPKTTEEVYAREQILLHQAQSTEVVVQGIRIGNMGIATTPTETYAITGLKIKAQSPLKFTMVFDLANGGDGYIPPPEHHLIGGYNTWAARSAGLEVQAEPRISEAAIHLLETLTGESRKDPELPVGPGTQSLLDLQPIAYWRLNEFTGPRAADASGHNHDGIFESRVTYYLAGPENPEFSAGAVNRAAHFIGERLQARIPEVGDCYSISLWVWNGLPAEARGVTGWFASRGRNHVLDAWGDHVGIGGTAGSTGKLIFQHGTSSEFVGGKTAIERWTWNHVAVVREGNQVHVYLNGVEEIACEAPAAFPEHYETFYFGGRCDNDSNWEGRLDEIAVFDRALRAEEVAKLAK